MNQRQLFQANIWAHYFALQAFHCFFDHFHDQFWVRVIPLVGKVETIVEVIAIFNSNPAVF